MEINSDEGLPPIVSSNDHFDWLGELLSKEMDDGLVPGDSDDVVVVSEFSPLVKSRKRKLENNDNDDECLVLDGDPEKLALVLVDKGNDGGSESDDLLVVGETGKVACRDYPHSRHDCIKFPFNKTPHEEHCDLCHCYVCDSPAPCIYWGTGLSNSDHCHATDKDGDWKICRKDFKLGKSAGQNTFSNDCDTSSNMVPLPDQTIHPGSMQSDADLTPGNPMSQQVTTYQSGETTLPVNTPRPVILTPQNLVSRPAVHHPSSQNPCYGNTSPANPQNYVARQPAVRRCSSAVSYATSDNIYRVTGQQQSDNLRTGLRPLYAPVMVSPGFNVVQPDGWPLRSNVRPQHVSSVAGFNRTGTVYCPPPSGAGYVPSNLNWATPEHFGGKFQKYVAVNAVSGGYNNFPRQNSHPRSHFRSDMRSTQFDAFSALPYVVPSISVGAQTISPIYEQIQDARAVDPSDHASHQSQGDAFQHGAHAIEHQPVQQSNHHLSQGSGLSSAVTQDNWWSENELYLGQLPVEPPPPAAAAAVDVGMLLFDFETPRDGATR